MTASKDAFLERLKEQQHKSAGSKRLLQEWQNDVAALLERIRVWLREPESDRLLSVSMENCELHEERFGTYATQSLRIDTPGRTIRVRPVGRMIVGGQGRVDIDGGGKSAVLIRTDPDVWQLAELVAGKWQTSEFSEDTFWKVLESLVG